MALKFVVSVLVDLESLVSCDVRTNDVETNGEWRSNEAVTNAGMMTDEANVVTRKRRLVKNCSMSRQEVEKWSLRWNSV